MGDLAGQSFDTLVRVALGRLALLLFVSAGTAHAQGPPAPDGPAPPPSAAASFPEAQGTQAPSHGGPPAATPEPPGEGAATPPATAAAPVTVAAPVAPPPPASDRVAPAGISQEYPDRSDRHAMPYGAVLVSAGFAPISVYRVAAGSSESVRDGEGSSTGSGTFSVHYHYPVIPLLSARGFFRLSGFETDLSVGGGYRAHTLYTMGIAPALSVAAVPRKNQSLHVVVSLPIGLVIGTQPGLPPRDAVEEDVNVGLGYRIGGAVGLVTVLSRHFGLTMDLEIARDDIFHRVTYRALDGRSPSRDLNLHYSVWSSDWTLGIVWVP